MCGIVGMIGRSQAASHLLDGLSRLQYRGYDSAGIATLVNGRIERRRAEGKLDNRAAILEQKPLLGVAPSDELYDKVFSNLQEVLARGRRVILLSDSEGVQKLGSQAAAAVTLPNVHPFIAPIVYAIPVQLLAYHTAVARGADVDHPRNLAKSVTVE